MEKALTTEWGSYGDGSIRDVFCTNAGMDIQDATLSLGSWRVTWCLRLNKFFDYDCSSAGGFQLVFKFSLGLALSKFRPIMNLCSSSVSLEFQKWLRGWGRIFQAREAIRKGSRMTLSALRLVLILDEGGKGPSTKQVSLPNCPKSFIRKSMMKDSSYISV
jgi:hypothetical protein